jgi:nicotinate-nucleotide adenylyltransferase
MNDQQEKCLELANYFEFMPGSDRIHNQTELPQLFLKSPINESVTFFGGSFNPFHQGHRACLDLCPEKNILIVPDCNPFKQNERTDSNIYTEFLELAESLKNTPYSIYPGFLALNRSNPTSSWLPLVQIKEKNFLMGDDSYMSILTWHNPEKLLMALTKLYIVPRSFHSSDYSKQENLLKSINPNIVIHYLTEHPYQNISSTKLRNN